MHQPLMNSWSEFQKKRTLCSRVLQVQKQSKLRGEYITMMYDEDDDVLADGGK